MDSFVNSVLPEYSYIFVLLEFILLINECWTDSSLYTSPSVYA